MGRMTRGGNASHFGPADPKVFDAKLWKTG
jgi:hypothetical protein